MANEIKDELTIRPEFFDEVIEAMEELRAKVTTQGEAGLLYFMMKTANDCID